VLVSPHAHPICHNLDTVCGRYRLSRRKQLVEEYFDSADWQDGWTRSFLWTRVVRFERSARV